MKTTNLSGKVAALLAIGFLGFVTSCKDSELANSQDVTDAATESLTESYFQDADDLSLYSINNKSDAGRLSADDYRLTCATINVNGNASSGTVTIDFGTGCTDGKGNIRKGKINLAYAGGPAGETNFTVTETFTDYSINGIELSGQRVIKRVEALGSNNVRHNIVLTNGKATWPDNSFATRSSDFDREINLAAGTITLSGSASGLSRRNKEYSVEIINALMYKTSCIADGIYMAVQGNKVFMIDGKQISIDYGTGECDRKVTVTVNGIAKEVTLSKN
jgi:hypothetical protein